MRTLISVVALFVLFGADVFGAIGSWPKTTTYTRQFLGATNADAARTALGIVATNSDVLTVNETNSTSVTNLVGRIVTSNNIVVGTIGTNLLSQSAYDALVGGGTGGSGDATLAGDNTWTGTNTFTHGLRINNQEAYITDDGSYYAAGLVEVGGPIRTSTGFYGPIVTNAENGSVVVEGVTFNDGGMDASNILTGTLDAARLPTTNSSWKFEAGSANTLVVKDGMVGIRTANPGYPLQVNGTIYTTGGMAIGENWPLSHLGRNKWRSYADKVMGWTDTTDGMLLSVTNGLLFSPSGYLTTGAITVRSNSWTTPPTLSPGDIAFLSQDGVPMVVSKDAAGVESTNRLGLRASEVIDVKMFGAVGDGVADDTEAITNAMYYAMSVSKPLLFPSGTYRQTVGVVLTNTIHIIGSARNNAGTGSAMSRPTIQWEGTGDWLSSPTTPMAGINGCTFEFLTVKGQGRDTSTGAGFRFCGGTYDIMTFNKVEVNGFKNGWVGTNWGTTLFSDCYARACDVGYQFFGATALDLTWLRGGAIGSCRIGYSLGDGIFNIIGVDCSATNRIVESLSNAKVNIMGSNFEHTLANALGACLYVGSGASLTLMGGNRFIGIGNYSIDVGDNGRVDLGSTWNNFSTTVGGFAIRDQNVVSEIKSLGHAQGNPPITNSAMSAILRPMPWAQLNFDNQLSAATHYQKMWWETRGTNVAFFDKLNIVGRNGGTGNYATMDLLSFEKYRRGHVTPLVLTNTVSATIGFAAAGSTGLTTNINVLIAGDTTNQLQFTGGILTGVVPQ